MAENTKIQWLSLGIGVGLAIGFGVWLSATTRYKREVAHSLQLVDRCVAMIETQRGVIATHETNHVTMVKLLSESSQRELDLYAKWQDCMEQYIRYRQLHGNQVP